jgi:hypothetical protein
MKEIEKPKRASLRPSDFTTGGLIDDVDIEVKEARFVMWDYAGQVRDPVPALAVTMETGGEGTPITESYTQYYSAGDARNLMPSADGKALEVVGGSGGLKSSSNAGQFLVSLVNAGFPEDRLLDGDISVMDGLEAHVHRIPQPERKGLVKTPKQGDREATILVVSKIHRLPWDKKQAKAAGASGGSVSKMLAKSQAGASTGPSTAAEAHAVAHLEKARTVVLGILTGAGGSIVKNRLTAEVFKVLASDPDRQAIVGLVYQDSFLGGEGHPWTYDAKAQKVEMAS